MSLNPYRRMPDDEGRPAQHFHSTDSGPPPRAPSQTSIAPRREAPRRRTHSPKRAVDKVSALWRARRGDDVQTYAFPAKLGLGHDIIDVTDPHMNVSAVYPKLIELIDR